MARIKTGAAIEDIRGTLGGVVYSVSKRGVQTVRSLPKNTSNPVTVDQAAVRRLLQDASQRWNGTLGAVERASWETLANQLAELPIGKSGGIEGMVSNVGMKGSGANAYAAFYTRACLAGLSALFVNTAPLGVPQPAAPTAVSAAYVPSDLTITYTDPVAPPANSVIAVWLRSRDRTYHPQVQQYAALAASPLAVQSAKGAKGLVVPFSALENGNTEVIIQLQTISPDGWSSPGSVVAFATIS